MVLLCVFCSCLGSFFCHDFLVTKMKLTISFYIIFGLVCCLVNSGVLDIDTYKNAQQEILRILQSKTPLQKVIREGELTEIPHRYLVPGYHPFA